MEASASPEAPLPEYPRIVVVREFSDAKAVLAVLQAGRAPLVVLRTTDAERTRVLDLLAGWAVGSGGELERIGPNTVVARPRQAAPPKLARGGVVSAVNELFDAGEDKHLTREDEERLVPLAAAGSIDARRQLIDAYSDVASVLALWLRPSWMSQAMAVSVAQSELDRLVAWPPRDKPLLVGLIERVWARVSK